jgi:hypothetical protein
MTSKHGKWRAYGLGLLALVLSVTGCTLTGDDPGLKAPYQGRHVWAVAPLGNESGTMQPDGVKLADKLAQRLETVQGIEVLAVNRVLAAMQQLEMRGVQSREQAMQLLDTLGAEGLVVGTITAYEPYEPAKLGLALDLYTTLGRVGPPLDVRQLSKAATDPTAKPEGASPPSQPVASVSAMYDASEPTVRKQIRAYAEARGRSEDETSAVRLYRISMDRYSEFVSHAIVERLLNAERGRLARQQKARAQAKAQANAQAQQNAQSP